MENQMNIENQNTQQIGQNLIAQPTQIQEKPKVNLWIISTIAFALLFIVTAGMLALNYSKITNSQPDQSNTAIQPSPSTANSQPSETPTSEQADDLKLTDFPNNELLGENDNYSVFLLNQMSGDAPEKTGELIVYDKKNGAVIKITGMFSIFGSTIVVDDNNGEYVLLSIGTSVSRGIIPLSLTKKALAGKEFCSISDFLFYRDYVIYGNCDTFQNRPWEAGQAASLTALNLINGQDKTIVKSDLMHQYGPTKISGDTLYYLETYVTKEEDWQTPDNQKTTSKTYSLLSL